MTARIGRAHRRDIPVPYALVLPTGGLTFSRRGGFKAFLARKAKTLLVPYYVFSLYFLAKPFAILLIPSMRAAFQTSHDYGIAHQFLDVLVMGNGLWFLMAFFVGECLMYGLTSLTDNGRVLAAIGMASVILSTFVSSQTGWPTLPFQIVAGVKAAGYMCVGYVLKEGAVDVFLEAERKDLVVFSPEERKRAVELYLTTSMTTTEVVEHLGYPTRQCLERRLAKDPRYAGRMRIPIIPPGNQAEGDRTGIGRHAAEASRPAAQRGRRAPLGQGTSFVK